MVVGGGHAGPDVLEPIAGVSMLVRSVQVLLASGLVERVRVVGMGARREAAAVACRGLPVDVLRGELCHTSTPVRAPAAQRSDHLPGDDLLVRGVPEVVVVHDARRPLAPPALARAVLEAVRSGHAVAVPVLSLTDTVKQVDEGGLLRRAPDRSGLLVTQTPQAFRADVLPAGLEPLHAATALAVSGVVVHTVPGDPLAFAISSGWHLALARFLGEGT